MDKKVLEDAVETLFKDQKMIEELQGRISELERENTFLINTNQLLIESMGRVQDKLPITGKQWWMYALKIASLTGVAAFGASVMGHFIFSEIFNDMDSSVSLVQNLAASMFILIVGWFIATYQNKIFK